MHVQRQYGNEIHNSFLCCSCLCFVLMHQHNIHCCCTPSPARLLLLLVLQTNNQGIENNNDVEATNCLATLIALAAAYIKYIL